MRLTGQSAYATRVEPVQATRRPTGATMASPLLAITVRQDPDTSDWLLTVGDVTTRVPVEQVEEFQSVVQSMDARPTGPRVGDVWDSSWGDRFKVEGTDPLLVRWRGDAAPLPAPNWDDLVAGCRYLGRTS